jgi:hypothetical protein
MHESQVTETTFGFLSAIHSTENGYFGGYLVISPLGRPLEFHCTAPVLPTRAQRILYGATLEPYLLGEQIGGTLIAAAEALPRLIVTDQAAFGLLRQASAVPLVLVRAASPLRASSTAEASPTCSEHASMGGPAAAGDDNSTWGSDFYVRDFALNLPAGFEADRDHVLALIELLVQRVDPLEPFQRIHEAIREAQRIGGRSQASHGQAA